MPYLNAVEMSHDKALYKSTDSLLLLYFYSTMSLNLKIIINKCDLLFYSCRLGAVLGWTAPMLLGEEWRPCPFPSGTIPCWIAFSLLVFVCYRCHSWLLTTGLWTAEGTVHAWTSTCRSRDSQSASAASHTTAGRHARQLVENIGEQRFGHFSVTSDFVEDERERGERSLRPPCPRVATAQQRDR